MEEEAGLRIESGVTTGQRHLPYPTRPPTFVKEDHPGQRALVVVGASHKPYLDACLHQLHDVRVVDVLPLLR